nr:GEVED domain-containing protein [uncultured Flavobacterium sp.]
MMLFLGGNVSAQTTLFSSGFETSDATFSGSAGTNTTISQPTASNPRTGTKSGEMVATGKNTSFSGSIITSSQISFISGRYYTISVWAKVYGTVSTLKIKKSATATNAAMITATGNDAILNPGSDNVTTSSYVQFSVTFQASSTENKYVGIQVISNANPGDTSVIYIDDISIIENTTLPITYCLPSVSSGGQTTNYIKEVNFIGNITNSNNGPTTYSSSPLGYQDWTTLGTRASQAQGEGVNIFTNTSGSTNFMKAWVDWNSNGNFDESTEIVYQCTNAFTNTTFGFKIPETTNPGNYRIRIRINKSNSPADNTFSACGNIANYGETEDYLFTVVANCAAKITSITNGFNCGTDRVTLGAIGTAGSTQYRWYDAQTGGTLLETTAATTWLTPSISGSKTFYVTAFNGSCESLFRTPVVATIKPIPTLTFANANPEVCGENSIIDLQASGNNEQVYLIDENFESGLGSFTNNNIATQDAAKTNWQIQSSTYVPSYPAFPVWYPAISSGFGNNKFAMSTSDIVPGGLTFGKVENALESAIINTTGFLNLSLSFKMYFSSYNDLNSASVEYVNVEVSTNGGVSWIATPIVQYLGDVGIGTQFVTSPNFNLNAFTGITSLKIRIRYKAGWCDGVAVDDIKLFGDKPLSPSFQWTSALPIDAYTNAACTIPYTAGTPASIVYVKPTLAQLEQSTYSFTAKANLANGCSTSAIINVTNKSKVWQNLTTDWNNSSNWKPSGVPTGANCVIIPNTSVIPASNYNAYAKNLTIKSTGNLELSTGSNLTVTDFVKVDASGIFNIRDKASLIQINETNTNTGTINVEKTTSPFEKYDYTYWSTPVTSTTINTTFPTWRTDYAFEFKPSNFLDLYDSETGAATPDGFDDDENDWIYAATMTSGKGYIIMGPTTGTFPRSESVVFNGFVNNGVVNTKIFNTPGTPTDDDWNLVGNPYPSAISADAFIKANSNSIDATLYFWTHKQDISISNPGPDLLNFSSDDYAMYNLSGGIGTSGSFIGTTEQLNKPSGNIAACQSFFVESKVDNVDLIFNNEMRLGTTNTQFYKTLPINIKDEERDRLWLNMENSDGIFSQQLIGYFTNTTNDYDNDYDGLLNDGGNYVNFYSFINEDSYKIQGRETFNNNDQVRLGYFSAVAGSFNINIDSKEGVFKDSKTNIYLEDKELNIIHDLKKASYVFNTEIGEFKDRFSLRYTDKTLGVKDVIYENSIQVVFTRSNNVLNITNGANDNTVIAVSLFNIQGKLMSKWDVADKEQTSIKIPIQNKTSGVYIVKLKTTKGNINKKIIIK